MSIVVKTLKEVDRSTTFSIKSLIERLDAVNVSRYEYLAILSELATELSTLRGESMDSMFSKLASVPKAQVKTELNRLLLTVSK